MGEGIGCHTPSGNAVSSNSYETFENTSNIPGILFYALYFQQKFEGLNEKPLLFKRLTLIFILQKNLL